MGKEGYAVNGFAVMGGGIPCCGGGPPQPFIETAFGGGLILFLVYRAFKDWNRMTWGYVMMAFVSLVGGIYLYDGLINLIHR